MDVREPRRQRAVAAEREDHARRTENVAGDKSERGDGCAREQDSAADGTEKFRGGFGQWRISVIGEIETERPLRDELDQDVNDRGDDEGEISGTRNGSRRIFYFAARDERDFDSDEGEDQKDNCVA